MPPTGVDAGQRLTDPLTGLGTRPQLLADLAVAVAPDSPPSLLVIFDLSGLAEHRDLFGRTATDELLGRLAGQLTQALGDHAACYRPRGSEFAALIRSPVVEATAYLDGALDALEDTRGYVELTPRFGAALLPDEAAKPVDALMLADGRLVFAARDRTPRERRRPGDV